MSKLTPVEKITARALELIRAGNMPPCPDWLKADFDAVARRNPDLLKQTGETIRRVIEKTTN